MAPVLLKVGVLLFKANGWLHVYDFEGLYLACGIAQVENVKTLLAMGASASAAAGDDMTGLHFAAQKGHTEVCRLLINSGARGFIELKAQS